MLAIQLILSFILSFLLLQNVEGTTATTSSHKSTAAKRLIPALKNHSKKFSQQVLKTHLRKDITAIDLESYVSLAGYFESVIYNKYDCTNPFFKQIYPVQVCAMAADPDYAGYYTKAWTYAVPNYNYYDVYQQFFTDPDCTVPYTDPYFVDYFNILICSDYELDHMRSLPLNPHQDPLGFTVMNYNTEANCNTNSYKTGLLEAFYGRLNVCFMTDTNDILFSSCSSSGGLVMNTYSSEDGSCTGTITPTTLTHSSCSDPPVTINGYALGYANYACSQNPLPSN